MRSLEDLQEAMRARLAAAGLAGTPTVPQRRDPSRAAMSFGQRYVWAHQQISPDSTAYNLCLALTFDGEVVDDALRQAFLALVRRHEVLRTTYHNDEHGNPYQHIHPKLAPRVRELDLTEFEAGEAERRLAVQVEAAAHETFDLSNESSLRLDFVRVDPRRLVVIVVIQHIAWDGMTLPALSKDVERFYREALTGSITVEPLRRQVADFAEWEQDRFHTADHAVDSDFWARQFDGEVPELPLPYNRRPVTVTERGSRLDRLLGPAADANLRGLSAALRTTPFAVFLAAYYLALRQITGQADVVVGTTVANREEPGMELLIGNFSNMLPLRLDPLGARSGGGTFAELVEYVRTVTTDAFRHKNFPQEGVVRAVNRATGNVGSALFDTMVLFLDQKIDGPQLPGAVTSWRLADHGASLLPIAVEAFLHSDRVDVQITYRTDLFDAPTIERLHDYLDQTLANAAAARQVDELLVLSPADRAAVDTWSRGAQVPVVPETVDAMIRNSVRDYPDRVAVIFGDTELTYLEFDARVNRLARRLLARGVRTGDRVGVFAERSEWLPVAFAAVLRTGAVYVPIDPSYPANRIQFMLEDAQPALLVRSASPERALDPEHIVGVPILDLADDAERAAAARLDDSPLRPVELSRPIHPLDAAYLLYTSGTTGRPKGVVINHRAVASHVQWMRDYLGFGAERILQKAPIGFDVSVFELVNALCTGSATVLPPPDWWQADVQALADIIERHRITQLSLVPSVTRAFLDAGPDPARLQSMRFVYLGGEAVPPPLVEEASRVFGGTVLGLYGPTEAAMDLMHENFANALAAPEEFRSALIGLPESNSNVYVLDDRLRQVPPGVTGELYLGGAQLAQGYHHRTGLSSATFVACPFADEPGARMYRTGDVVRWHPSGSMEYLGRIDDQVKVRGHRIELGEVGSVLRQVPGIASAAAIALERDTDTVLVAYYVPEPGSSYESGAEAENSGDIRIYLADRLPDYMIPSALVKLDALPLTANGKLDRRALPVPDLGSDTGRGRALRDPAEQAVAAVIRQVLGLAEQVELAADDDFLALGGDSISAIRMASALKKRGLLITTSSLFAARTIALIAAATEPIDLSTAPALVESGDGTGWIPLNPIATLLTEQSTDYAAYSQATALVTPMDSSLDRLTTVVHGLVDRHPLLRARLATGTDGRIAYYVPRAGESYPHPVLRDIEIDSAAWASTATQVLNEQLRAIAESLDPAAGRMVGAAWVHSGDRSTGRLLLVLHHLVVDGVSWRVIHEDLRRLWAHEELSAADLGTSVQAWNTNLVRLAQTESVVDLLPFWRQIADSADPLLGDRAFDAAVDTVATVREVTAELDSADTQYLMTTAAQAFGCDFLDIQVAALAVATRRFRQTRERDADTVKLTMERHGRVETLFAGVDLANAVGWFTTAYPVALDLAAEPDMVGAVKAVKEQLRAVPDSGIGWGLLRQLNANTAAPLAVGAPPQLSFNYMGRFAVADVATAAKEWDAAPEFGYLGGHANAAMPAPALLDINTVALLDNDSPLLRASFRFPSGPLAEAEVREFADLWTGALRELAKTVREDPARRLTPSDVLAREVTQLDLDRWQSLYGRYADVYPLAPLQAGLYFTAISSAGRDAYTVQTTITVRGALDVPRLTTSLNNVLNRYPNLRVAISVSHAGQPYAIVADRMDFLVEEVDYSTKPDAQQRLLEFLDADQAGVFDLSRGPLMRATVVHLPDAAHMLVLASHHVLTDGWSGQLLPREIFADYASGGTAEPLGNPATFAEFLRLTEDREEATEAVWNEYLAGVQPCVVAPNRVPGGSGVPVAHRFPVDAAVADALTELAAAVGTTFSAVCQFAWANVLRYVTGGDAAVFGEVVSGRPADLDEVDHAIGCFVNTVPVAIELPAEQTWRGRLTDVQRRRADLMEFQQYRLTSANRIAGARRLFDSMFVFQSYPSGRDELVRLLGEEQLELIAFEGRGATDNALLVMIFPADLLFPGEPLQVVVFYAEDSFDDNDIQIIEAAFTNTLRAIATDPDRRIGDTEILDDADLGMLVMRRMWQ
ncbi:amino acid adenylation domain-containing protein [Nocardia sp. NPDC060256]|uniref:amino acid adenylation domain-containing protein n=1 Tax=unclassified Nocardia TaxID=2637762 RepID=UPI00366A2C94